MNAKQDFFILIFKLLLIHKDLAFIMTQKKKSHQQLTFFLPSIPSVRTRDNYQVVVYPKIAQMAILARECLLILQAKTPHGNQLPEVLCGHAPICR